eukprot:1154904-Pelagomonas_calceolata.AAC.1
MHKAALSHLSAIESTCAKKPARLNHICGLPARGAVEDIADKIVNLIKECHEVALQVCTTKVRPATSKHFRTRRISNLRRSLCNKLKSVRHVLYNLPQAHLALTFDEVLALNSHDSNLHKAILFVQSFSHTEITPTTSASNRAHPPLPFLESVLQAHQKRLKEQINKIDSDYSTQCHIRAQRRQQRKIAKHPALANKEIFKGKSTAPPQAQALTDPTTGVVETDPCKVASIVE